MYRRTLLGLVGALLAWRPVFAQNPHTADLDLEIVAIALGKQRRGLTLSRDERAQLRIYAWRNRDTHRKGRKVIRHV